MPKVIHGARKRSLTPQGYWNSPIAGIVHYQSGYEWRLMEWLDEHNICWKKCTEHFKYVSEIDNKVHQYTPDLIIETTNDTYYIEIKGAIRASDPSKFRGFPNDKNLVLLSYKELHNDFGLDIKDYSTFKIDSHQWPYKILKKIPDYQSKGVIDEELKKKLSPNKLYKDIGLKDYKR